MGEHVESPMNARRQLPLPKLDASTPLPTGMPVAGGWGYTRDEPCIITDHREPDPDANEAQGRDHALRFIPERLLLELNAMQMEGPLARLKWRVVSENLEREPGGKPVLDHFSVNLSGYLRADLEELEVLEQEAEGGDTKQRMELHLRQSRLRFSNTCDFWFDVSGVRGIPDDADMYMLVSQGHLSHDE